MLFFSFFLVGEVVCWVFFFFSSRRRHTRSDRDWSSDVCSSDLLPEAVVTIGIECIERERESPRSGFREAPRHILRDADAVGADDDPESTRRRTPDDLEDVAP